MSLFSAEKKNTIARSENLSSFNYISLFDSFRWRMLNLQGLMATLMA